MRPLILCPSIAFRGILQCELASIKKMKSTALTVLFFLGGLLFSCSSIPSVPDEPNFQQYYDQYNVSGSFVLYGLDSDEYIRFNKDQLDKKYTPASTFKICHSLIGIETREIEDENFIIEWDSVPRQNLNWNKDTDLKGALQNSTVWYYQELATRIGGDTMKYWLDKLEYGNADISGGIEKFWLTGGLRITPNQQISFLQKLVQNNLPLSQRTMDIVKDILLMEENRDYKLFGKTGWGVQDGKDIGWFIGFIEVNHMTYVFANCIQTDDPNNQNFAKARTSIVYNILTELELM